MSTNESNKNTTITTTPELDNKQTWLSNNLYQLMIWTSVAWFGIVLFYISQFFGWSNLFLMMPDEFGGFLAGVTLPLAILWVVVAYIDRGTSFKTEARLLRSYMNQLVYPEEGAAQTAKAMADGIRSQVVELQNATKLATEQSQKIKNELNARVEDFAGIITTLDQYSSQTVEKLSETLKQLTTSFEMMNEKALSHSGEFKNIGAEVSGIFAQMNKEADLFVRNVLPNINEVKYSAELLEKATQESNEKMIKANETILELADKSHNSIEKASEILEAQAQKIALISEKAVNECDKMRQNIDNSINSLADVMQSQNNTMKGYVETLNQNADTLRTRSAANSIFLRSQAPMNTFLELFQDALFQHFWISGRMRLILQ